MTAVHNPLRGRASYFYGLTVLSLIGTAIVVAVLFTATHQVCNEQLSCRNVPNGQAAAWTALVVGAVQTVLLLTIAQLCQTLGAVVQAVNDRQPATAQR